MGWLVRTILATVPAAWAESMEHDSRAWEPRKLLRCPACGRLTWHRTHWQPDALDDGGNADQHRDG